MGISLQELQKKSTFQYASIVTALVLVGQLPDANFSLNGVASRAVENIASVVGMAVAVPANKDNTLAQELQSKEIELNEREKEIDAREREFRAIAIDENNKQNRILISAIALVTIFLISLIGLNFYLDRRRSQHREMVEGDAHPETKTGPHAHEGEYTTKL